MLETRREIAAAQKPNPLRSEQRQCEAANTSCDRHDDLENRRTSIARSEFLQRYGDSSAHAGGMLNDAYVKRCASEQGRAHDCNKVKCDHSAIVRPHGNSCSILDAWFGDEILPFAVAFFCDVG